MTGIGMPHFFAQVQRLLRLDDQQAAHDVTVA
jgi:hypothetical protein